MLFNSPSLNTLSDQALGDLKNLLRDPKYFLPGTPIPALAYACSGLAYMLHVHIDQAVQYQLMPRTAKGEALELWANSLGLKRRKASKAFGKIMIQGEVPSEFELTSDSGMTYQTRFDSIQNTYRCEAKEPGRSSNLLSTSALYPKDQKIKGKVSILSEGITGGSDPENDEELSERVNRRLDSPLIVGTEDDYILWSQELPFVGKPFIYPRNGGSSCVGVAFLTRDYLTPLPSEENQTILEQHLLLKKPITAEVKVISLEKLPIPFKIWLKNKEIQLQVEDILKKLIFEYAHPNKTISYSRFVYTISQIVKDGSFDLKLPNQDISLGQRQIGVFGGIEWI